MGNCFFRAHNSRAGAKSSPPSISNLLGTTKVCLFGPSWRQIRNFSVEKGFFPFVMSEPSRGFVASDEPDRISPDLFSFYTQEVVVLLSQDEDFLPFSSKDTEAGNAFTRLLGNDNGTDSSCVNPLFCNSMDSALPDIKRELLKALLRQSVCALGHEVDEMQDPVIRVRQILSRLTCKKQNCSVENVSSREATGPCKMLKTPSSSVSMHVHANPHNSVSTREELGSGHGNSRLLKEAVLEKRTTRVTRKCALCGATETPQWRNLDGRKICSTCGHGLTKGKNLSREKISKIKLLLDPNKEAEKSAGEVNDDFQFLLEMGNSLQLKEMVQRQSDELSRTLHHMEHQLEELLDAVISKCRPMTYPEKLQLQKFIQKLPPKNLDRVVEIIHRKRPSESPSDDEIFVDLEKQDNITLWRLYFYVKAVENARKLPA
ncbi:hypothetical protein Nepgr_008645 [Nepenthes gracilis]|uniref:GATA-type domain-containing protein n=1 Tax=Nepenthes gracilis TaxID=150966 RepID=A0AAD3S9F7_NEPGR|nr:hypothetical protein Nepgr_008645 [Nepenthes gracilis]